jgi:ribonuclease-3
VSYADVLAAAEQVVGYRFKDRNLLQTALTHSSIANSRVQSNERLEFLGDSVLGLVVCEQLYRSFGKWLEGDLTKAKSDLVSRRICAKIADEIGLTESLILGNGVGERHTLPTSLRAAVYESIIGAIFLDGGIEPARRFILNTMAPYLDKCADSQQVHNYKSLLQQYAQRQLFATPQYEPLDEQGPDHSKCFEVCVVIDGERFPSAWGPSKKEAEQEAAKRALERLREREPVH